MKKWFVLLLAILMVVSLAACNKKVDQKDNTDDTPTNTTPTPVENPFTTVDEVVYTSAANVKLYADSNFTTEAKTLEKSATELHRIQISDKYQASVVEYKGESYYVQSSVLTTQDLYGKTYKVTEKTMYAKDKVALRSCASDTLGETVATLAKNDEVKVVAEGGSGWCKVAYAKGSISGQFFVQFSKLSAEQEVDYTKLDFSAYFTSANVQRTVLQNVNLRIAPVVATATSANGLSLKKDEVVKIVGYGKGAYASWGIVHYPDTIKEGDVQTYTDYYVKLCSEDCTDAYIEVPQAALDNQITKLGFTKGTETLYVKLDQLKLRFAPSLTAVEAGARKKGEALEIVASGNVTEPDPEKPSENVTIPWAMVKVGDVYLYASKNGMATTGNMDTPTLEQLLAAYPSLSKVTPTQTIQAKEDVNCKTGLSNSLNSGEVLKKDTKVTLVAQGAAGGTTWYVFKTESGAYYCGGKDQFEIVETQEPVTEQGTETDDGQGGTGEGN